MKRAVLYLRVSTLDQHPENQLADLRQLAAQRGFEIIHEYTDHGGMRRARLEGRHIGRRPLDLDHEAIRRAGALGKAILVIIGVVAELERNLLIERVRAVRGSY